MGGYETLRPEQGGGDGGDADYLGFRSRWESTEIRNTGPRGAGLADAGSQISAHGIFAIVSVTVTVCNPR